MADEAVEWGADVDLLDLEQTRELESCLQRGRPYANLTASELDRCWVPAFRAWFRSRGAEDGLGYYDLDIEMELRGLEPPVQIVRAELALSHAQLAAITDNGNPALNDK